ncbi:MAG TPA: DUF5666 domain-containing protein [Candidatus Paceibacterota bacterium]
MSKKVLAISLSALLVISSLFLGGFILAYQADADTDNDDEMAEEEELNDEEDEELEDEDVEDEEDEDEDEDDEVEDITEVELDDIPLRFGKFELGGTVTATNTANSTITVNGLSVNVAGANIHRGNETSLSSVLVGDRVRMSGRVEDGALKAERVIALKSPHSGPGGGGLLEALREEIREQIRNILEQIEDLRERLKAQQGES